MSLRTKSGSPCSSVVTRASWIPPGVVRGVVKHHPLALYNPLSVITVSSCVPPGGYSLSEYPFRPGPDGECVCGVVHWFDEGVLPPIIVSVILLVVFSGCTPTWDTHTMWYGWEAL